MLALLGCTKPGIDSGLAGSTDSEAVETDSEEQSDSVHVSVTLEVDVGWVLIIGDEEAEWDYIAPSEFPAGSVLVDEVAAGTWSLLAASPEHDRCASTEPTAFSAGDSMMWTVSEFTGEYDYEADFFSCLSR